MSESLGARIRAARTARGLSLRSVAQSLGVSASLVSQIEIGKTQPSVSTLYALASHLGVSIDELMGMPAAASESSDGAPIDHGSPSAPIVQQAADNPVIEMENGVRWERLAVGVGGPVDAILVTYAPGATSSVEGKLMRHAGVEYAYLIEGELTLQLEFDTHILRPGDSLHFDSIRPHLYLNHTDAPAKGVWFVLGRRQQNLALPDSPLAAPPASGATPASAVDVLRAMDELTT